MDPFRTCPHCRQRVRIIYRDLTTKTDFLFDEHVGKDFVTRCSGSKTPVQMTESAENSQIVLPVTEEISLPEPVQTISLPSMQTCPACRRSIRIKKNLRGTIIFVEHRGTSRQKCPQSFKAVDPSVVKSVPSPVQPPVAVTKVPPTAPEAVPLSPQKMVEVPATSPLPQLRVEECPECGKSTRVRLGSQLTMVFAEHYNTLGRLCTQSLKPIPKSK